MKLKDLFEDYEDNLFRPDMPKSTCAALWTQLVARHGLRRPDDSRNFWRQHNNYVSMVMNVLPRAKGKPDYEGLWLEVLGQMKEALRLWKGISIHAIGRKTIQITEDTTPEEFADAQSTMKGEMRVADLHPDSLSNASFGSSMAVEVRYEGR